MRTSTHRRGAPTSTSRSTCDERRYEPPRPRSGSRWPASWAARASGTATQAHRTTSRIGKEGTDMRVMMMIKGDPEPGAVPGEELLAAMGSYNDELKQAGVLLDLAGLLPSVAG